MKRVSRFLVVAFGLPVAAYAAWQGSALTPAQVQLRSETLANVRQIGFSIRMYVADSNNVLPIGPTTADVVRQVKPYMRDVKVWSTKNPKGGKLIFNSRLVGKPLAGLGDTSLVPMVYETASWPDGSRIVAYPDGHARAEGATKWKAIEEAEKKAVAAEGKQP